MKLSVKIVCPQWNLKNNSYVMPSVVRKRSANNRGANSVDNVSTAYVVKAQKGDSVDCKKHNLCMERTYEERIGEEIGCGSSYGSSNKRQM